jgi:plastocyanin
MAISGVLMLGTVGTAIVTAKDEPKSEEQAGFENKVGKEGSEAPDNGGTPAAGGTGSGQGSGENGENAAAGGTITKLTLTADKTQLAFDKADLEAPKGNVRITMTNPSAAEHNIALEGPGGIDEKGPTVGKGGASEVEASLKPGSYTFYCSVTGHREAGMEGTLTVK